MEEQAVIIEEQNELFSRYPKEMDEYFVNKKIVLKTIPTEFLQDLVEVGEIQISSAEQYYDFLTGRDHRDQTPLPRRNGEEIRGEENRRAPSGLYGTVPRRSDHRTQHRQAARI